MAAAPLPIEILLGVYLGLLTGIIPALVSGALGFLFRYFTGVTLPGLGVVVLAVAIAGVNGGLLGLIEPTISQSPRLLTAVVVVMMLALYAHSQGDRFGTIAPRRFSLRKIRQRTLSADVIEMVGGIGEVTIRPRGPIEDMEGYPPLPAPLRSNIAAATWTLPADLPLSELETRLEERLRTEFELTAAVVSIDADGRARIAAAPPTGALSRRVPAGHRAISVDSLVPMGMTRGESVAVVDGGTSVEGTLVSAWSGDSSTPPSVATPDIATETDGDELAPRVAPTTDGGDGRVTVAVPRRDTETLLGIDRGRVVVRSRGVRREFELVSLLRRAGKQIGRVTVGTGGPLDGSMIAGIHPRETYGVAVLAIRLASDSNGEQNWTFSPRDDTTVSGGDELFVVGSRDALERFRGAVA